MIFDHIDNLSHYTAMHPLFAEAVKFLKTRDWMAQVPGRYDIPGTGAWVSLQDVKAHPKEGATVEYHRRYIDIQYVLKGHEIMGWAPLAVIPENTAFDTEKDVALIPGGPVAAWLDVNPGHFAVFFPSDVHAPCCGSDQIRKIVVKIPVEQ